MARYRISRKALRDLDSIWLFIARENEPAANGVMDRLYEVFQTLVRQPRIGKSRPEIGPGVRSFVAEGLIIFYQIANSGIRIVRVWDARQDPRKFAL